jgi:Astacin (Peptidase family M12A)
MRNSIISIILFFSLLSIASCNSNEITPIDKENTDSLTSIKKDANLSVEVFSDSLIFSGKADSGYFLINNYDTFINADFNFKPQLKMLPYFQSDKYFVFQGDIILDTIKEIDLSKIAAFQIEMKNIDKILEKKQVISEKQEAKLFAVSEKAIDRKWIDNTVYYAIDANIEGEKEKILEALSLWSIPLQGIVNFIQVAPLNTHIHNYAKFTLSNGYSSNIGMVGKVQEIKIPSNAIVGKIAHEIGHLLGLWHEHSHPNRNNYVKILANNIKLTGNTTNDRSIIEQFEVLQASLVDTTKYDFSSIMHYPNNAFAQDGKITIEVKKEFYQYFYTIGQRTKPSQIDVGQIKKIYSSQ